MSNEQQQSTDAPQHESEDAPQKVTGKYAPDMPRERKGDALQGRDLVLLEGELAGIVGKAGLRLNEPMSEHTTFQVGGPADLFVTPRTPAEVRGALRALRRAGEPLFVLGKGSDLLVADAGYRGAIVCLSDHLTGITVDGEKLVCLAGTTLKDVSDKALDQGLTGFEFACGIPGRVGGACFMNAGAYGGQMADVLESVDVVTPDGEFFTLGSDDLDMGYRTSRVRTDGLVVVQATIALQKGDPQQIAATIADLTQRRESKQPLEYGSAGSTFKRPEGYFAGKLITDAGLKGYRVGNACVSTKHAGFVVNLGGATSADVHAVISHVQDEVRRQFGVNLEPEVRFLG